MPQEENFKDISADDVIKTVHEELNDVEAEDKGSKMQVRNDTLAVLVVEDDAFLRGLMVRKLEEEGFQVMAADTGEQALEMLREKKPNIILLDILLPGIGGFELLKKLKENPETKGIAVIILSNLGQQSDIEQGMALGAQDFLVKANFTPHEIVEKIQNTLSAHKGESSAAQG